MAVGISTAVMAVVALVLVASASAGRPVLAAAAIHVALTLFLVAAYHRVDRLRGETGALIAAVVVIGSMFYLYTSLGHVVFTAVPWDGDPWLRAVDRVVGLGGEPVAWLSARLPAWSIEPLAFGYAAFIPYLYLTIFLGLVGRPPETRAIFVLAFALTYGLSFMGYLFVPARGPIVAMADVLGEPLVGGTFLGVVTRSIDLAGGPHGAFPSLHIGAACLGALVDYRHGDRLRAFVYVPLLLAIAVATVALRYHYVIDLVAGGVIAWTSVLLAEHCVTRRSRPAPTTRAVDVPPSLAREAPAATADGVPIVYRLMRSLLRVSLHGFFRRVAIQGRDRIPTEGPVLLIGNHTNAFVDPLVVLAGVERRVTLTAKSTLAKDPLLAPVIRALGVILLHRPSDREQGADPSQNLGALSACVDELGSGGAVFIFPEGVSHSDPSMRPFKTGTARIVADYLEAYPGRDLMIVPVGLHYSKKDRWRSEAVALIGEPVSARAWAGARRGAGMPTGDDVDVRALTDAMRDWVDSLTLNFADDDERELAIMAEELLAYDPVGPEPLGRAVAEDVAARVESVHRLQHGADRLRSADPDRFEGVVREARVLHRRLRTLGVAAEEVPLPMRPARAALFVIREVEVFVVGGLLGLVGWLANWPALALTRRLVRANSEDDDHWASNAVFLSMPIFLLWWLTLLIAGTLVLSFPAAVLGLAGSAFMGWVHLLSRDRTAGALRRSRTFLLWLRRPDLRAALAADLEAWRNGVIAIDHEFGGREAPDPAIRPSPRHRRGPTL